MSGSLWMFKRNEPQNGNADMATNTSTSFKYESSITEVSTADGKRNRCKNT